MKKILIPLSILLIAAIAVLAYWYFTPKQVHYHAGFKVWVDGTQQDYSNPQYMSLIPCGAPHNPKLEQLEKAHLHDQVGDVVHIHRSNALWADLFKNIHISFGNKPIEAYVNGKKVDDLMSSKPQAYDSVIILVGKHGDAKKYLSQAVKKNHIMEVEKKSELCGKD